MVRKDRSAAGTVEQAATPVSSTLSEASRPRNISPSSSAVLRESVLTRHECTILSPSKVAKTVLVFPMSIVSSTVYSRLTAPCSLPGSQVERDIHDRRGVGQGPDREVVHTGPGELGRAFERQAAGRFELGPIPDRRHDLAQQAGRHVVA